MSYALFSMYPPITYCDDHTRTHAIYIMKCEQYVKVGIAADIEDRLKGVNTHNPFTTTLEMYRTVPFAVSRWIEGQIHAELKEFHHRGEWFACGVSVAKPIVQRWCSVGQRKHFIWAEYVRTKVGTIAGTTDIGNVISPMKQRDSA